jgi:hypothetical protein
MGALPWTLRTSGQDSNNNEAEPMVVTSESSPLPKSAGISDLHKHHRRSSLDNLLSNKVSTSKLSNSFNLDTAAEEEFSTQVDEDSTDVQPAAIKDDTLTTA